MDRKHTNQVSFVLSFVYLQVYEFYWLLCLRKELPFTLGLEDIWRLMVVERFDRFETYGLLDFESRRYRILVSAMIQDLTLMVVKIQYPGVDGSIDLELNDLLILLMALLVLSKYG